MSPGGKVTVSYSNGEVFFVGAYPNPGFDMEVEDKGPDEVRVDFESDDEDYSVRIEWGDGKLDIEIN